MYVACLDPSHRLFLPSVTVNIDGHPGTLNTFQNEQWKAWPDKFAHVLRSMWFETLGLYFLLIAEVWNSPNVAKQSRATFKACRAKGSCLQAVPAPHLVPY